MPSTASLILFGLIALGMVLTPGPNMIYLISRSIIQGRHADFVSLGGVALGFMVYMLLAVLGITAVLMVVPYAYDALRLGGGLRYAWQPTRAGEDDLRGAAEQRRSWPRVAGNI